MDKGLGFTHAFNPSPETDSNLPDDPTDVDSDSDTESLFTLGSNPERAFVTGVMPDFSLMRLGESWAFDEDMDVASSKSTDHDLDTDQADADSHQKKCNGEALLALPVFKQESIEPGFQYILNAATSPATKMNEETLTYLNQGQSYEIKMKKFGESADSDVKCLRNIVRVVFHDRRLQFMEREQLATWRQTRPGERILDIDVPLCHGITDICRDSQRLNTVEFKWDPSKEAGVFIKVHCISTEFTAKKHGGEKGVPFRIQVETYLDCDSQDNTPNLVYCASCQIKVFKPKGADRKHKTDRERMEKRSEAEKEKYQPSYECTVLIEIPLDQAQVYLRQQEEEQPSSTRSFQGIFEGSVSPAAPSNGGSSPESHTPTKGVASFTAPVPTSSDLNSSQDDINAQLIAAWSPWTEKNPVEKVEPLAPSATSLEVARWLHTYRFSNYVRVFQNFSGADLLRLTKDDLIQICGLADGIRLNNALQSKAVRPRLTIYVCQESACNQSLDPGCSTPSPSHKSPLKAAKFKMPVVQATTTSTVTLSCPAGNGTGSPNKTSVSSTPPVPPPLPTPYKRQFVDADSPDEETVVSSKKQRTRNLEMSHKTAYHAIYLEDLTVPALVEKVAQLYSVQAGQILEVFLAGPSGILIHVTDEVVANFADQSRFSVEAVQNDTLTNNYRLLMKQATE